MRWIRITKLKRPVGHAIKTWGSSNDRTVDGDVAWTRRGVAGQGNIQTSVHAVRHPQCRVGIILGQIRGETKTIVRRLRGIGTCVVCRNGRKSLDVFVVRIRPSARGRIITTDGRLVIFVRRRIGAVKPVWVVRQVLEGEGRTRRRSARCLDEQTTVGFVEPKGVQQNKGKPKKGRPTPDAVVGMPRVSSRSWSDWKNQYGIRRRKFPDGDGTKNEPWEKKERRKCETGGAIELDARDVDAES